MLERGQEVTEAGGRLSKWRLVRVAVVALSGSTYVGRLFFGDSDTGEVVWDCDVRPSDGGTRAELPLLNLPAAIAKNPTSILVSAGRCDVPACCT